jgi:cold shock CspA family protein
MKRRFGPTIAVRFSATSKTAYHWRNNVVSGKIKYWKPGGNFGFIERDDGLPDLFVHVSVIRAGGIQGDIGHGLRLRFEVEPQADGRQKASRVEALAA